MKAIKEKPFCSMCGLCCRLFLINLNEKEYYSGKYITYFEIEPIENFSFAEKTGATLLKQQDNGDCVYLKDNRCSIHNHRPSVCKGFFCNGTESKYKNMRKIVQNARHDF